MMIARDPVFGVSDMPDLTEDWQTDFEMNRGEPLVVKYRHEPPRQPGRINRVLGGRARWRHVAFIIALASLILFGFCITMDSPGWQYLPTCGIEQ